MANSAVVGLLRVLLTASSAEFEAAMDRASDKAKTWTKEMRAVGRQATELGAALTKTLTLPIAAVGAVSAKAAMEFESSFAGVRKTVQATESDFAQMAQGFRNLAKEIPVNVNELNRLGEAAGALGIPKAEVVDFARVMALLGVTTNVTSDQAAESIAKIQNIFGAAGKDTERFASTLVALGNDGASTEAQILEMSTRIAGAGNAVGMTQGQVLAFASALSSVGIEAEMGGSAISRVFIDIASAVNQGGTAVNGFADVAGTSVEKFSQLFKEDAAAAVNQFIVGLSQIKQSGGDLLGTIEQLGFSQIRVRDTLLRAAGAGDLLTKALTLQDTAWRENSALTREAGERFKTTESQLALLGNRVRDVGITLGNALLPLIKATVNVITAFLPILEQMAHMFGALPVPVQAVAVALAATVAAAGPAIWAFGQLALSASALTATFTANGIATKALTANLVFLRTGLVGSALAANTAITAHGLLGASALAATTAMRGLATAIMAMPFAAAAAGFALVTAAIVKMKESAAEARLQEQTAGAMQDTINAAVARGATQLASMVDKKKAYTEALKFNAHWQAAYVAQFDKSYDAQKRGIEAELALGRISQQTANSRLFALNAERHVSDVRENNLSLGAAMAATEKRIRDEIAATGQTIPELTHALATNEVGFKAWAEANHLSSDAIEFLRQHLRASTKELKDSSKENKDAEKAAREHADAIHDINLMLLKGTSSVSDFASAVGATTKDVGKAIIDNYTLQQRAHLELDEMIRRQTLSRLAFELDALHRSGENQKLAIDRSIAGWERAADAIDALTEEKMRAFILSTNETRQALASLAGIFPQLLPFLHEFAAGIDGGDRALSGLAAVGQNLKDIFSNIPDTIASAFTGGGGLGGALKAIGVQFAKAIMEPMLKAMTTMQQLAVSMASSVAGAVGGAVGGGSGAMVGSLAAGLAGAAIKASAWGAAMTSAGVAGSVALGATTMGIGLAAVGIWKLIQHNRNLNKEVKEWNAKIDETRAKLLEVHGTIDDLDKKARAVGMGRFTDEWGHQGVQGAAAFAEFIKEFEKRWKAMNDEMQRISQEGGRASAELKRFMSEMKDSAEVIAFIRQQADSAIDGFSQMVSGTQLTKESLEDLGIVALATFNAAIEAGTDYQTALQRIGPALSTLQKAYADLGLSVEDSALKALFLQNTIATNNPALITGISGLTQAFVALDNIGMLNVDTFQAMQRQGLQMYTRLQAEAAAAGGATRDALMPMQGFLHEAAKQAELLGIPLDANLQMLIDQSKELGIWKERGPSAAEDMTAATNALAEVMRDVRNEVQELSRALRSLPATLPNPFEDWRPPVIPDTPDGTRPPGDGRTTSMRFGQALAGLGLAASLAMPVVPPAPSFTPPDFAPFAAAASGRGARGAGSHGPLSVTFGNVHFTTTGNPSGEELWDGLINEARRNPNLRSKLEVLVTGRKRDHTYA